MVTDDPGKRVHKGRIAMGEEEEEEEKGWEKGRVMRRWRGVRGISH